MFCVDVPRYQILVRFINFHIQIRHFELINKVVIGSPDNYKLTFLEKIISHIFSYFNKKKIIIPNIFLTSREFLPIHFQNSLLLYVLVIVTHLLQIFIL